jgi:hypothetical protein
MGSSTFVPRQALPKLARISNDHTVRVAPCNWRGKPLGPVAQGTARVMTPGEHDAAYAILKANYSIGDRLFDGVIDRLPIDMTYIEVVATVAHQATR